MHFVDYSRLPWLANQHALQACFFAGTLTLMFLAMAYLAMAEDLAQETQQPRRHRATCGVSRDAVEVARLAHLDVHVGATFFTKGPKPCAVEYSAVPGVRRGRIATGTKIVVLEAKTHTCDGYRYVAARIASTYGVGDGWVNLCRDAQRFVVPTTESRRGSNNVVAEGDDASTHCGRVDAVVLTARRRRRSRRAPGARPNPY